MAMKMSRGTAHERSQGRERMRTLKEIREQNLSMVQLQEYLAICEFRGDCRQEGLDGVECDVDDENAMDSDVVLSDQDDPRPDWFQDTRDALGSQNSRCDAQFPILPHQYEIRVYRTVDGCLHCRVRQPPESVYYKVDANDFLHAKCAMRYALLVEVAKYLEEKHQEWLQAPGLIFREAHIAPKNIYEPLAVSSSQFSKIISDTCLSWGTMSLPLRALFSD